MRKAEDFIWNRPDLDYENFAQWLDAIEHRWSERTALSWRAGKGKGFDSWTYARLAAESRRVARALLSAGLGPGDRVALWAENSAEWCSVWIGAAISGTVIVPVDFLLSDEDAANILERSGAKAFFVSARKLKSLPILLSRTPTLGASGSLIVSLGGDGGELPPPVVPWTGIDGTAALPDPASLGGSDAVSVIFTSGTTGLAKGVVLSHRGIIANASAAIRALPIFPEDVFMCVLPLHHTYPTTCSFISPLCEGCAVTLVERVVGKIIVDDTRDSGGSIMTAVPLLFDKLKAAVEQGFREKGPFVEGLLRGLMKLSLALSSAGFPGFARTVFGGIRKKTGLAGLRLLVAGGGPLNPSTADFFESLGWIIVQGYGMSENGPLITVNLPKFKDNASAGVAVPYTEIRIRDANEEGVGEIAVRSPSLMLGYFNNSEATAEVFDEEGFLRTGDLGYLDERGFLFITGRKKSLIVTAGGKNIYPEEIEAKFDGSRVVKEVLVVGRKGKSGAAEDVVAVCVPDLELIAADRGGAVPSGQGLRELVKTEVEAVNRSLPPYKKIVDFILRDEEFEQTSSRKIKRFLYQDLANKS